MQKNDITINRDVIFFFFFNYGFSKNLLEEITLLLFVREFTRICSNYEDVILDYLSSGTVSRWSAVK